MSARILWKSSWLTPAGPFPVQRKTSAWMGTRASHELTLQTDQRFQFSNTGGFHGRAQLGQSSCQRANVSLNAPAARVATLPSLDASSSFYFLTNRLLGTGAKREGYTSIFMSKVSIREILTWGFSPRNVPIVSHLTSQSWLQRWFSIVCEFSLSRMSTYQRSTKL